MLTFFVIVSWWVVGVVGFVFWWTKYCDFTSDEILISCVAGLMGPLWIFSCLHTDDLMSKVIIKKRDTGENGVGE